MFKTGSSLMVARIGEPLILKPVLSDPLDAAEQILHLRGNGMERMAVWRGLPQDGASRGEMNRKPQNLWQWDTTTQEQHKPVASHKHMFPEPCFVKMSFFLLGGEEKVR